MKTRILDNAIGLTAGLFLLATVVILLGTVVRSEAEMIEVSGEIAQQDAQWFGSNIYLVTDDVTVPKSVCLFIEPRTTVKIEPGKKITVYGRLIAEGSSGNKITFVSNDPGHQPWQGLFLNPYGEPCAVVSSGSILRNVLINDADVGISLSDLNVPSDRSENITIDGVGIEFYGFGIQVLRHHDTFRLSILLANVDISNCVEGISFHSAPNLEPASLTITNILIQHSSRYGINLSGSLTAMHLQLVDTIVFNGNTQDINFGNSPSDMTYANLLTAKVERSDHRPISNVEVEADNTMFTLRRTTDSTGQAYIPLPVELEDSSGVTQYPTTYNVRVIYQGNTIAGPDPVTVTIQYDSTNRTARTFTINQNLPPTARFVIVPPQVNPGDTVTFDASGSFDPSQRTFDPENLGLFYIWDFDASNGIGQDASGATVTHQYTMGGTYTITLTVKDVGGGFPQQSSQASHTVTVVGPPTAQFTFSPQKPNFGDQVEFDGSGSSSMGKIVKYTWEIRKDGTLVKEETETESIVEGKVVSPEGKFYHAFSEAGIHDVTLKVEDNHGQTGTASRQVPVNQKPTAHIDSISPSPAVRLVDEVTFEGHGEDSDGTIVEYAWRSDIDGLLSTSASFTTKTLSRGEHTIYFKVKDDDGAWSDEVSQTLTIFNPPTVTLSVSPPSPLDWPANYHLIIKFQNDILAPSGLTEFDFTIYEKEIHKKDPPAEKTNEETASEKFAPVTTKMWSKHFVKNWEWIHPISPDPSSKTFTYDIEGSVKDADGREYNFQKTGPPWPVIVAVSIPEWKKDHYTSYLTKLAAGTACTAAMFAASATGVGLWAVGYLADAQAMLLGSAMAHYMVAEDPPEIDTEYGTVVTPVYAEIEFPELPVEGVSEFDLTVLKHFRDNMRVLIKMQGDLKALMISKGRLYTAIELNDEEAIALQEQAVSEYTEAVIKDQQDYVVILSALIQELERGESELPQITPEQFTEFLDQVEQEGFPLEEIETFKELGVSDEEVETIRQRMVQLGREAAVEAGYSLTASLERVVEATENLVISLGGETLPKPDPYILQHPSVSPDPPVKGQPCTLSAVVRNDSPTTAFGVLVQFLISDEGMTSFEPVGTTTVTVPGNRETAANINWVPPFTGDRRLKVKILTTALTDSNLNNNEGQKNITINTSPPPPIPIFAVEGTVLNADGTLAGNGLKVEVKNLTTNVSLSDTTGATAGDSRYSVTFVDVTNQRAVAVGDKIKVTVKGDKKTGMTEHTVTAGEVGNGMATIDLVLSQLRMLEIIPESAELNVGQTLQFKVIGRDQSGNEVPAHGITWEVLGEIGTIDQNGLFTATAPGEGKVKVTDDMGTPEDASDDLSAETEVIKVITIQFTLNLVRGINLISIPLNDERIKKLSDLANLIGPNLNLLIWYDTKRSRFTSYLPTFPEDSPANVEVTGSLGLIAVMKDAATVAFAGDKWDGKVDLVEKINLIAVPVQVTDFRFSDLAEKIGADYVSMIIRYDMKKGKFISYRPTFPETSPANAFIRGGESYIVVMRGSASIKCEGNAWSNTIPLSPPASPAIASQRTRTPVLVTEGLVRTDNSELVADSIKVTIRNLNTGESATDFTGTIAGDGCYLITLVDILRNSAAQVGDILEISALDTTGKFEVMSIRHTVTHDEILAGKVTLEPLRAIPLPKEPALLQNYPNPFNPETWIPFKLSKDSKVTIRIFNVAGQLVRTIEFGEKPAGYYINKEKAAHWDGRNNFGEAAASSVYFYQLTAGNFAVTRKMAIMK